jgi:aldose sugar dehydrogenase
MNEVRVPFAIPCRASVRTTGALALLVAVAACGPNLAVSQNGVFDSEEHRYRVVAVATGLEHPWGMAFLPNGDLLVTERPGRVRLIRDGRLRPDAVAGGPEVVARGQGGLMDVVLHPEFETNALVYLSYSKGRADGRTTTAVARARWDGDRLSGLEDVFVADAWERPGRHYGSRIVFDGDGMMYVTVGDRGRMERAQDRSDHAGTTIRLHDDGRVPADNPFVGQPGVLPEIYTYGNRNAQGMAVHPATGEIWQNEHGPRGGDEINLIRAGVNYGWPRITHGIDYSGVPITPDTARAGMEQPLLHWTPSIAPSGLAFYTGDRFPEWRGNVFVGALANRHVRRVVLDGTRPVHQERLLDGAERIRDIRSGPDGYLYLLTDSRNGAVLRLEPVSGS